MFNKIGFFDVRLTRGQVLEFNKRIKKNNGKIYIAPEVSLTYFSRNKFSELIKHYFRTGFWVLRIPHLTKDISSVSLRHSIPLLFLLGQVTSTLIGFICSPLYLLIPASYLAIILESSISISNKNTSMFYVFVAFVILHFSYGVGSFVSNVLNLKELFLFIISRMFALLIFIVLLPIYFLVSLIMKLTSEGPIIYWSRRGGRNNRIFLMPKFRTMYIHAPDVATLLLQDSKNFITPIGSILRKTSLDEVPQLISIIKGI